VTTKRYRKEDKARRGEERQGEAWRGVAGKGKAGKEMAKKQQHIVLDLTDGDADGRPFVEDGIPLPLRHRNMASKYPFARMKINQSFFVAGEPLRTCRTLCQAVANYGRKFSDGKEFAVRSRHSGQPENVNALRETGARCWRVK
jgi:hypothetical protein